MYLEHFALSAPPFQFTASPTALFMSRTHRECLAALEWGLLHEPSGLTLLAGEAGVGKTTLLCALLARQYREVRAAYLGNPRLDFVDLLASVLNQLGIRGGRASKAAMLNAFAGFANGLPANERVAVIVDEAQALSDDAMEDFRLLSNLERHGSKAAQIILAGQLELARRLTAPEMRHFNERIGARAVLIPLTRLESRRVHPASFGLMRRPAAMTFFHAGSRITSCGTAAAYRAGSMPCATTRCCSPTRMASSGSRWRWPKMRLLITRASAALPVHHSTRHGFPMDFDHFLRCWDWGYLE